MLACGQRVLGKGQTKRIINGQIHATPPLHPFPFPPPRSGFVQPSAPANGGIALLFHSARLVAAVAELGSFGVQSGRRSEVL
jgi:hypothetical protein